MKHFLGGVLRELFEGRLYLHKNYNLHKIFALYYQSNMLFLINVRLEPKQGKLQHILKVLTGLL